MVCAVVALVAGDALALSGNSEKTKQSEEKILEEYSLVAKMTISRRLQANPEETCLQDRCVFEEKGEVMIRGGGGSEQEVSAWLPYQNVCSVSCHAKEPWRSLFLFRLLARLNNT